MAQTKRSLTGGPHAVPDSLDKRMRPLVPFSPLGLRPEG